MQVLVLSDKQTVFQQLAPKAFANGKHGTESTFHCKVGANNATGRKKDAAGTTATRMHSAGTTAPVHTVRESYPAHEGYAACM
jgi:hypothetical protein